MKELNEFLSLISEAKKESDQKQQELNEKIRNNSFFDMLLQKEPIAEPIIDQIIEHITEEVEIIPEQIVPENLVEDVVYATVKSNPLLEASTYDKLFKTNVDLFNQPNLPETKQSLPDVTKKLQYLENWVSKIAAAGPGSGEVNLRYLDDVNRNTMEPSNDNWVLEYDATTKKVQFTEDLGPVRTLKLNTTGPQIPLVPGTLSWNPDEDCMDITQNDGTTLQVGLEQYIRVHNHTANTLTNGTVVQFAGVENTNEVAMPICDKYLANAVAVPLLLIGVLTDDITPNGIGRATTFGYVRDLNTTGADVGETWLQGDLLWGHPTQAGKMTKVRPTAPNVATSIAAVVKVGTTDGQLLVRPTIFPRLFFGSFYDTTNQTAAAINTPYAVKLNTVDVSSGFNISSNTRIVAQNAGLYNFQFSLQVVSSSSQTNNIWIWYRKNGVDANNSATKLSLDSNKTVIAPSWNFLVSMATNDYFQLMWAVDSTNISLAAPSATSFAPDTPSVILTVNQVNL